MAGQHHRGLDPTGNRVRDDILDKRGKDFRVRESLFDLDAPTKWNVTSPINMLAHTLAEKGIRDPEVIIAVRFVPVTGEHGAICG